MSAGLLPRFVATGAREEETMATRELAVERVEFICGRCQHRWLVDYDVQHCEDDAGMVWEYFAHDGMRDLSPYTLEGAQPCPNCGRLCVGRLAARRDVPLPPVSTTTEPRYLVADSTTHRPDRQSVPPLPSHTARQPTTDQRGEEGTHMPPGEGH
jgi:hypothetical protein